MNSELRPPSDDAEPDEASVFAAFESLRGRCPAPELVFASKEGALPGEMQSLIIAHVERCHVCQALGEAMASLPADGMTAVERDRIQSRVRAGTGTAKPPSSWWSAWRVPIATLSASAALVVAVLGGWMAFEVTTESPAPALPPVRRSVAGVESPPLFRLEKLPLPRSSTDLLWRGASERLRIQDELDRALEPFGREDFAESARRLRELASSHPRDPQIQLYLGISESYLERHREAIQALSTTVNLSAGDPEVSATATWYLALTYDRGGDRGRALATLERLCQGTTVRAAMGCAAHVELTKLNAKAR